MVYNKKMIKWGVSALFHDASIVVEKDNVILFASSAERFSRVKSDKHLNVELVREALKFGYPDKIYWYENTFLKSIRILLKNKRIKFYFIKKYLKEFGINSPVKYTLHHLSHLRSSAYTAPFSYNNSLGVVVDAVGEFDSLSIWDIENNSFKKLYSQQYPHSLGLFYSALTDYIGLNPTDEEYILMGMSAYGGVRDFIDKLKPLLNKDLSRGCRHFLDIGLHNKFDIAFATQKIFETELYNKIDYFLKRSDYKKIIYAGGCALNCKANSFISSLGKLWIFPNPGDSGSGVGAIDTSHIKLKDMFLGYDAGENNQIKEIVNQLTGGIPVGVINSKAEFGPRALGNRSILADPRDIKMKNIVNNIKGRELFRPFAPCVLDQFADEYFQLSRDLDYTYMQFAVKCKQPHLIPAVVHVDGTSRVQVVTRSNTFLYNILTEWYKETGCPVLLNTSLNVKGKPIANSYNDLHEFKNSLTVI